MTNDADQNVNVEIRLNSRVQQIIRKKLQKTGRR